MHFHVWSVRSFFFPLTWFWCGILICRSLGILVAAKTVLDGHFIGNQPHSCAKLGSVWRRTLFIFLFPCGFQDRFELLESPSKQSFSEVRDLTRKIFTGSYINPPLEQYQFILSAFVKSEESSVVFRFYEMFLNLLFC